MGIRTLRRFGKTLNMSMLEQFFSVRYAGRSDLFEGPSIWQEEKYRLLQGTYPVIALSFAEVKGSSYQDVRKRICRSIADLYRQFEFLMDGERLSKREKELYQAVSVDMEDYDLSDRKQQVKDWYDGFDSASSNYNDFLQVMLSGDIKVMNAYMNKVTSEVFSYFDTGQSFRGERLWAV